MRRTAATATLVAVGIVLAGAGNANALRPGATAATGALDLLPGEIAAGDSGNIDRYGSHGWSRPSLSADGRWVAFLSGVDALSGEAERDAANVFRKDRRTGRVVFVSRATGASGTPGRGAAWNPVISDDGRRIAWGTYAALDPADTDDQADVYVRDLATQTTTLATPGTAADVDDEFDFSGDGSHVAFVTGEALAPGDVSGLRDVYRRDLAAGTTELVSLDAAGGEADTDSSYPSISAGGRWVAFVSAARDLVTGIGFGRAGNPYPQVYARDMNATTDATTLVSHSYGQPLQTSFGDARDPHVTVDGGGAVHVAFASRAQDLHQVWPYTTGGAWHGYVRDLSQPETELLGTGYGVLARADTTVDDISADGRRVVFSSTMTSIGGPTTNYWNIYVRDVASATTTVVTGGRGDADFEHDGAISDDGAVVSWLVNASIVPDLDRPFKGVYARTLPGGPVELISRPRRAGALRAPALSVTTLGQTSRRISADGRYVVLEVDGPAYRSVYRRDTWTGALEPAARLTGSSGALATEGSYSPSISDDGSRVVFVTGASLDPADPVAGRAAQSVYMRDYATATTTLVSREDGFGGANLTGNIGDATISGDGRHVLLPGAGLLVRDVDAGRTTLVGRADGPSGAAVGGIWAYAISADGTIVAFDTNQAIDPDDPDPYDRDVYVRDVAAETTRLVSRQSGASGAKGNGRAPVLNGDGNVVAFLSSDEALAPEAGGWHGEEQVVARDLTTHQNTLVSRAPGGPAANDQVWMGSIDASGAHVAFESRASNLLPGHGGRHRTGVFVVALADGSLSAPPPFGPDDELFSGGAGTPSLSANGRCLAFVAVGANGAQRRGVGDIRTSYVYALPETAPRTPRCRTQR
jgi:Tol biopolymer transport system component